ncbi:MAG: Crp/Fnr family transcriptional regulator [Desulfuromonadales bacterium]
MMSIQPPLANACRGENCSEQLCREMKRELGFFSFLSEADLEEVSQYFHCRKVKSGENVWTAGDPGDYVAFIVSGRVQIKVNTEFPGKQVVVGVFSRGAAIGVNSTVVHEPRNSTARAMDDTGLILINQEYFDNLIDEHPRIGVKLLQGMLLSETTRLHKVYARLASIF